jgi:hypothetical protein|tara:strand:+ start:7298 stop:7486 length:189 start_codon:yes stop_codon:yes gene_type:complete
MIKYSDDYVRQIRKEKKNNSIKEIGNKHGLTRGQIRYILYSREIEPLAFLSWFKSLRNKCND